MAWGYMRAQGGGAGEKEMLCGNYYYPGGGNGITCSLYYLTKDGAYGAPNSTPDSGSSVAGEYLEIRASWDGSSWSKGAEVSAKKPFCGVLYTSPSNGIYQESQDVTYNAGDAVIPFTSKIGNFILEIK